jgi:hypothetical protein
MNDENQPDVAASADGRLAPPVFGVQCALDCYAFTAASCTHEGGCPRARAQELRASALQSPSR